MDKTIPDEAAIVFSRGFYDAVGAGREIEEAFNEGRSAMQLASFETNYVRLLRAATPTLN